jgi:hypothetical protein
MRPDQSSLTVADICDAIGRKVIASRLGVGKTAVSNAVAEGVFPARWYREINMLCLEHDVPCCDEIFNFVRTPGDTAPSSPTSAA